MRSHPTAVGLQQGWSVSPCKKPAMDWEHDFDLPVKVAVLWCTGHAGTPEKQVCVSSNCASGLMSEGWRLGHRVAQKPLDEKQGVKMNTSCQKRLKKFAVAMWWCKGTERAGGQPSKSSGYFRHPEALILSPVGVCVTAKLWVRVKNCPFSKEQQPRHTREEKA